MQPEAEVEMLMTYEKSKCDMGLQSVTGLSELERENPAQDSMHRCMA